MIDGITVIDNPKAWSYTKIPGTNYNILDSEIRLFEDQLNPGEYPLFANSTGIQPLATEDGLTQSFNEDLQKWEYVENHIGEKGFINGEPFTISQYGPLPDGFTKELPRFKRLEIHTNLLKSQIAKMLSSTDFLMMPDYPLGDDDKKKIIEFRYKLRNLDKEEGYPWFEDTTFKLPEWPLETKTKPY